MTTFALEGLPFAGKSSCGFALIERDPSMLLLADYHDLLPTASELAQVPDTPSEQGRRIELYLKLDRSRWRQAQVAQAQQIVFDRCHVSLLAYAIALRPWIGTPASEQSTRQIESALADTTHPLRSPSRILYLEMSARTASGRCRDHATSMQEQMRTVEFAQRLIDAYETVLSTVESEVVRCSSEQPLQALQREVEAALQPYLP